MKKLQRDRGLIVVPILSIRSLVVLQLIRANFRKAFFKDCNYGIQQTNKAHGSKKRLTFSYNIMAVFSCLLCNEIE